MASVSGQASPEAERAREPRAESWSAIRGARPGLGEQRRVSGIPLMFDVPHKRKHWFNSGLEVVGVRVKVEPTHRTWAEALRMWQGAVISVWQNVLGDQAETRGDNHGGNHERRNLEANKAAMRRYIEELWNQRKWHVIDEIIDPGYRSARPSFPGESGIEDLKKNCPPFMAMFPDGKWSTLDMVAEGDKVACAWEFNATHTKDGMGIREVAEALRLRRRGEADDRSLPCRAIAGSPIIGTTPHP